MGLLFGGVPSQDFKKARVVLIPVSYDATTSYRPGARDGPAAILAASAQLDEPWGEEQMHRIVEEEFFYTAPDLCPRGSSFQELLDDVARNIVFAEAISRRKIPFLLGGEHSLTYSAMCAFYLVHQNFSILHFDAHPDLRDAYMGNRYSHACVMRRCFERGPNISLTSVGIRSVDCDTSRFISQTMARNTKEKSLHIFYADAILERGMPSAEVLGTLKNKVYITIDLDVLDPSVMPAVGTPQPDGLTLREVLKLLAVVFKNRIVIGMDVVELAPIPGVVYPNVTAAKLVWRLIEMCYSQEKFLS